jgi:putative membrane protein
MKSAHRSIFCSFAVGFLLCAGALFGQGMGQPSAVPQAPPNAGDMPNGPMAPMDNPAAGDLHERDRSFVQSAAQGGKEEVELGKLAVDHAANPGVKAFGQRMVADHSRANDQLRQLVASKGMPLPDRLDRKSRADYDHLAKLSGPEFDRAYVRMMVKDHEEDVAEFNRAARDAADPDIRHFASATLPTLNDHLRMARSLQDQMAGRGR